MVNPATNFTRTSSSGADGTYVFTELPPGTYTLTVEATGFQKYERSGVELRVALPSTVNVPLQVGAVTQVVSVSGEAPLLNTTDASIGETMGSTQIQQLPLEARNVAGLLSAQPGVVYTSDRTDLNTTTDTRSGAVNGEHSDQSNITLDGVDVNDQLGGQAFTSVLPVTVDSVQEFRVSTSNYDAKEGRSAGGQMELVTKGGTNNFHGSLYEYNRNTSTVANDYFIKTAEALSGQPNKPPKLIRNIFGGSLGGPFMKNRFFFFFNYEGRRDAIGDSAVRTVPSATLRDGIIQYICADQTQCPGGSVVGASGKSYPVAAGNYALGPSQLQSMDPLGVGPSSAVLKYFNTYPLPNDTTVGDGLNYVGYRFAAPAPAHYNWIIGRLDYKITSNGNHSLFFRGSGKDDTIDTDPFLPGTPAQTTEKDLSKGFVVGYTGVFGPRWVNNFRYGLTRQSLGTAGDSNAPWVGMRGLSQDINYGNAFTLPVHNFVDDVSWTTGAHNMQFGGEVWLIRDASSSTTTSFSNASTNAAWIPTVGIANTSTPGSPTPFDPAPAGFPAVDSGFNNSYDFPLIAMLGIVTEDNAQYNFHLNPDLTGTALAQGAPVQRHYSIDEYDLYWQDTWQMRPNLTFTYGVRWSLMSPIWESAGQEVAPSFGLGAWFNQRGVAMKKGLPSSLDPSITFAPAGPVYGKPGYYGWQTRNFAPRIAFAWTPRPSMSWLQKLFGSNGQTVIRAGWGMYYDHFGAGLATTFDQNGAFGLSTSLSNPAGIEDLSTSPRIGTSPNFPNWVPNVNTLPITDNNGNVMFIPSPPATFPQTFPNTLDTGGFAIAWGMDSSIRTPYSYAIDFSIDRELPGNMSLSLSYVGHLAHRLLAQSDLAMPYDLVDPRSGIDYFTAASKFSQLARAGTPTSAVTAATIGPTGQYWVNVVQPLVPGDSYVTSIGTTQDPVQAAYDFFTGGGINSAGIGYGNETTPLFVWDYFGIPGVNQSYFTSMNPNNTNTFFNPQYSSLYAWRSIGYSNYHSFQASLQKRMNHGLLLGFNYTFSKSLDIESDAERVGTWGGLGGNIINAWSPYQMYGPSDYDLRHQFNADWVYDMPFGRGRALGSHVNRAVDAVVGGWEVSGLARWTSGFPVNVATCFCFPTDWQLTGNAILTGQPIQTGRSDVKGSYNMFPNPTSAMQGFDVPFPGQSGVRNAIRGDGYAGWDMGLSKTWHMPYNENHTVQFRWDVFNVPNLKRFDVQSASLELDHANTFGKYTHLLTNPRVMQFALRYQF